MWSWPHWDIESTWARRLSWSAVVVWIIVKLIALLVQAWRRRAVHPWVHVALTVWILWCNVLLAVVILVVSATWTNRIACDRSISFGVDEK